MTLRIVLELSNTLTETVAMLNKKVDAINHKLDKIIGALANDNAIQEDEPLGI